MGKWQNQMGKLWEKVWLDNVFCFSTSLFLSESLRSLSDIQSQNWPTQNFRNTWLPEFYIEVAFVLLCFNQCCLCCQKCTKTENKTHLYMFLHLTLGHYSLNPISVNGTGLYSKVNTLNMGRSSDRKKFFCKRLSWFFAEDRSCSIGWKSLGAFFLMIELIYSSCIEYNF